MRAKNVKVMLRYNGPLAAPIARRNSNRGQHPGKPERTVPLIAGEAVPETGVFGRMMIGMQALIGG